MNGGTRLKAVQGFELTAKDLSVLAPGESAQFAARVPWVYLNAAELREPLLVLTDQRLIITGQRLLGKRKADFAAPWREVRTVDSGPWHGTFNPLIQLDVQTSRGTVGLAVQTLYAADVESAVRAGYLSNPDRR
jgi:hypothetical protein